MVFFIHNYGNIENLILQNFTVRGECNSAGIAASNDPSGSISNCAVLDAELYGGFGLGGIVGQNYGEVSGCFVENTKLILTATTVYSLVGGVAEESQGTIVNCFAEVQLEARSNQGGEIYMGGLAGSSSGVLDSSYSVCEFSKQSAFGTVDFGGICGIANNIVTDCWYEADPTISRGKTEEIGSFKNCYSWTELEESGKTRAETIFSMDWLYETLNWDLGVWSTDGDSYPKLAWRGKEA